MATVLFIVTIPTAEEERCLKTEFLARKYNVCADQMNNSTASTTTAEVNGQERATLKNIEETTRSAKSETTFRLPWKLARHFDTYPKRRRQSDGQLYTIFHRPCGGSLQEVKPPANDQLSSSRNFGQSSFSSAKGSIMKQECSLNLEIPNDTAMEIVVRQILQRFHVLNAVWTKDVESRRHQIIFTIEFNENYERLLEKFQKWGIGEREGSSVSVMNCIVAKTYAQKNDLDNEAESNSENLFNAQQKRSAWERFMNSVHSRLNIVQIVRDVRQNAAITFDFVILLISAAILASFGLIENSVVFLASSMLISPLMGPIDAAIFGTVIKDASLRSLGWKNEILGIVLATIVGFIFGLIICMTHELYGINNGLTKEILDRCELRSVIVGILTAIPSGAAGAIGILGGNIGSLVGVAISASLLPPAVNSGILWALACCVKLLATSSTRFENVVKTKNYSDDQAIELAILGAISMCVTITNVICVYILGIIVLKVKEIAPAISSSNREFWKHDIKIARGLNRNHLSYDTDADAAIIDEFTNLPKADQRALGINYDILRNIKTLDDVSYQNTWSPSGIQRQLYDMTFENKRENYTTIHQLEHFGATTSKKRESVRETSVRSDIVQHQPRLIRNKSTNYRLLQPRCAAPSNETTITQPTDLTSYTTATTLNDCGTEIGTAVETVEKRKKRKFIVTLAAEDPLLSSNSKDVDV